MILLVKQIVIILTASILLNISAAGQLNNHLILKKGPDSKMHFLTGDSILLMKNNFKTIERAVIQAIGENFIVINNKEVNIKEISGIVKQRALHFKAAGSIFKIAGPGLIFLDGFNSLLRGFRPLFSPGVAIVGGAIFGTGFILPLLQTKVYYMKRGYYLRIVPSDPGMPAFKN